MKTTNLVTFKPVNDQLKKLVAYYYIHNSEDENSKESFYFYPNYLHALTIYKGNDIKLDPKIKKGSKHDNHFHDVLCLERSERNVL